MSEHNVTKNTIQGYLEYLEKEWHSLSKASGQPPIRRWATKLQVHPLKSSLELISSQVLSRILPDGFVTHSKTFWGETMWINFITSYGLYIYSYYPVPAEIRVAQYLLRTLDESSVFFDVGANIGFFSKLAAWRIGIPKHVHAFEPSPRNFEILRRNNNNLLVINNKGCLDRDGIADFYEFSGAHELGESTMHSEYYPSGRFSKMAVAVVTLDQYCAGHDIVPDTVKIDVEGAEPEVLSGMSNLMKGGSPEIIMEVWKGEKAGRHKDAVRLLLDNSYLPHHIVHYGALEKVTNPENFWSCIPAGTGYDNIVFIKSLT